jgi:hypothetical protein
MNFHNFFSFSFLDLFFIIVWQQKANIFIPYFYLFAIHHCLAIIKSYSIYHHLTLIILFSFYAFPIIMKCF